MTTPLQRERLSSSLFSTAVFRPVLLGKTTGRVEQLIVQVRAALERDPAETNLATIRAAYAVLRTSYRSEYYYKNLLASKLFVGRHRASAGSTLLHEFRVGSSIADCVLLNGNAHVFEIKTSLDNPEKLLGQVSNYFQAFSNVSVVVHEQDKDRYMELLSDTQVGVLAVGRREHLSTVKDPIPDSDHLDHDVMLASLRAAEVANMLEGWYGRLSHVPNGRRYRAHLDLARAIPAQSLQALVYQQLRARLFRGDRKLLMREDLAPLRSLLLQLSPTPVQEVRLRKWLEREV